ncbi:hypothetical protein B7486_73380, partial [cyanobacterium TDX16]
PSWRATTRRRADPTDDLASGWAGDPQVRLSPTPARPTTMGTVSTERTHRDAAGPEPDAPGALDREAVLDAAAACYLQFGVAKTTAADIAKAAGTSRATLYRRFGTHEEILLEVLTRESEQMLEESAAELVHLEHPADQVVEGMVRAMGEVRTRPVHAAVFGDEAAGWVAARALRATAMRRLGEIGIRPLLEPALDAGTMTE